MRTSAYFRPPSEHSPFRGWRFAILLLLGLLLCGCSATRFPLSDLEPELRGYIHRPEGIGPFPAVILLHGMGGMREDYHIEAEFLAKHGHLVLVLDYYRAVRPGGVTGNDRERRWLAWQDEVVRAYAYLQTRTDVAADRIALVGYSQGAAMAISTAHRLPGLRAIVDFFGPNVEGWYVGGVYGMREHLPADYLEQMPPVLIQQGSADPIVPESNSQRLHEALLASGRVVECHVYPGSLHSFHKPISGTDEGKRVAREARERTLRFLRKHLSPPGPKTTASGQGAGVTP
ncbi:MAG: alpha/beta fold hydrolase [Opitutaceae bacterium]|nr:alpha/beta fold hydrolase [Opitutaceae bacterium]